MRYSLFGLAFVSAVAMAEAVPTHFDKADFQKRFHAADKDKNGKLSRTEAYSEFPRMPEFFDEIDTNEDDSITLIEVNKAMERRVNAAMGSGDAWKESAQPAGIGNEQTVTVIEAEPTTQFSSKQEARRYHRYKFYESLAEEQEVSRGRGESEVPKASPNLIQKSF